jgi:chromosome partitioning protein
MVPAKGLGWPDRHASVTYSEPPGLHHGHAEPEGPELAQIPDGADGAPGAGGLGWPVGLLTGADELLAPALEDKWSGAATGPAAPVPAEGLNGTSSPAGPGAAGTEQALSADSRETASFSVARPTVHAPTGNVVEDAMQGGTAAQGRGDVGSVVIPEVPQNPRDTPIARAAEAVLGARGAGDDRQWLRPASCRVMTVANQKGGVGKTTTAVNLAASLAQHGSRVLVVDLDPQGNASTALDVDHRVGTLSVYNTLVEDRPLADIVQPVEGLPGLYCAPATIDLAGAEIELVPLVAREGRLARAVAAYDSSGLDYILIDCPPSLGLLTLNALVAAREVLIPIQCEYYALEGLEQLLRTVDLVKGHLNEMLQVTTILLTMYDGRTRLAAQVADDVRSHFGDVVLQSIIPRSVRVSEAPSYGQSVITYDPGSSGSIAYVEAARELSHRHPAAPQ